MAFKKLTKKRVYKRKPVISKAVKTFVKKQIQKEDRLIIKDNFNVPGIVPNILLNTVDSIEISDVSPFNSTVGTSNKEQRLSNDIGVTSIWSKWNISLPAGASNIFRFMLIRYAQSSNNGITAADVLQHNGAGQAVISPVQDQIPYQILMDKCYTLNNPDGVGAKRYVITIKKSFKKRPLRIEYDDNSTTGLAAEVSKGLLRLYYFQATNAVGQAVTILNHCTRFCYVDLGNA